MKDMNRNIESRVTEQGQTILPKPVLEALGLKAGGRVATSLPMAKCELYPCFRFVGCLAYFGMTAPLSVWRRWNRPSPKEFLKNDCARYQCPRSIFGTR